MFLFFEIVNGLGFRLRFSMSSDRFVNKIRIVEDDKIRLK